MPTKEKKSAAEISKMIQDELDPMHERGTVHVHPGDRPASPWMIVVTGSDANASLLDPAHERAAVLSQQYEIDDEA